MCWGCGGREGDYVDRTVVVPVCYRGEGAVGLYGRLRGFKTRCVIIIGSNLGPGSRCFGRLADVNYRLIRLGGGGNGNTDLGTNVGCTRSGLCGVANCVAYSTSKRRATGSIVGVDHVLSLEGNDLVLNGESCGGSGVPVGVQVKGELSSTCFGIVANGDYESARAKLQNVPTFLCSAIVGAGNDHFSFRVGFLAGYTSVEIPFCFIGVVTSYSGYDDGFQLVGSACLVCEAPLEFTATSVNYAVVSLILFAVFTCVLPSRVFFGVVLTALVTQVISNKVGFLVGEGIVFNGASGKTGRTLEFFVLFFYVVYTDSLVMSTL